MHGSKLFAFIQSDMASNTLLLIPNKFGTFFDLGVQKLETLEQLEIQYSKALAKPERKTFSQNRLLEALRITYRDSHRICLPVLYCFFIAAVRSIETYILPQL